MFTNHRKKITILEWHSAALIILGSKIKKSTYYTVITKLQLGIELDKEKQSDTPKNIGL